MHGSSEKKTDIPAVYQVVPDPPGDIVLREVRKKRRMSQNELAEKAEISVPWLKQIEAGKEKPGEDARRRLRAVLEQCPVHQDLGIQCGHKLPVPPDDELYSRRGS